jgi:hypothetical protein
MHQSCVEINTISERIETSFHLTHATKRSIGCGQKDFHASAQTMHLSWALINIVSKHIKVCFHFDPRHQEVPSSAPHIISEPIAASAQILHLSCIEINTISK